MGDELVRTVEKRHRAALLYPVFLAALIVTAVPASVSVPIIGAITLTLWMTQPVAVRLSGTKVTFRVLPFWGGGIEVQAGDLRAVTGRELVTFRTLNRRRIPLLPLLWTTRANLETDGDKDCAKLLRDHGVLVDDRGRWGISEWFDDRGRFRWKDL